MKEDLSQYSTKIFRRKKNFVKSKNIISEKTETSGIYKGLYIMRIIGILRDL